MKNFVIWSLTSKIYQKKNILQSKTKYKKNIKLEPSNNILNSDLQGLWGTLLANYSTRNLHYLFDFIDDCSKISISGVSNMIYYEKVKIL